jgi:hypothetical protein
MKERRLGSGDKNVPRVKGSARVRCDTVQSNAQDTDAKVCRGGRDSENL